MYDIYTILWFVFWPLAALYLWVSKSFISQPDHNVPEIFRHPFIGKALVLIPQIGFLIVVICGFAYTSDGGWFLAAVIVTMFLATRLDE